MVYWFSFWKRVLSELLACVAKMNLCRLILVFFFLNKSVSFVCSLLFLFFSFLFIRGHRDDMKNALDWNTFKIEKLVLI
jgi:hypothetical protein